MKGSSAIINALTALKARVELSNSLNLTDINVHAEEFYREFLNLLLGYQLVNMNIVDQNFPAIDLGDEIEPIAIQVTATATLDKVRKTVRTYGDKKLNDRYGRLVILNIGAPIEHRAQVLSGNNGVALCTKRDIWTIKDLLKCAQSRDIPQLQRLKDFLTQQITPLQPEPIPKEIETFLRLIEILSDDVAQPDAETFNEEPDPNGKINERFATHADFLKTLYTDLYKEYGATYQAAMISADLGHARIRRLGLHLKHRSDTLLQKAKGNPREAFDMLVAEYSSRLACAETPYDEMAIMFFLVDQLIRCNVFPNKEAINV
ncbi:MAG: SMEK domain-containing protein [Rhodomicrobiaceae bacterium]